MLTIANHPASDLTQIPTDINNNLRLCARYYPQYDVYKHTFKQKYTYNYIGGTLEDSGFPKAINVVIVEAMSNQNGGGILNKMAGK